MLNYPNTASVVASFYEDCANFWKRDGKNEQEAYELAKADVRRITTNPYSPKGELLDEKAKNDFLIMV